MYLRYAVLKIAIVGNHRECVRGARDVALDA
jgi:hypothetical protein